MTDWTQTYLTMMILTWTQYIFRIFIYSGIFIACALGWKKKKNPGFIAILISALLSLLHHLPSIYCRSFYTTRRLSAVDYGQNLLRWSYIDYTVLPVVSLLLVLGLFLLALKKNPDI
ncbi:hypothetical protein JW890_04920 [candidate division WOR-3 bacterium]|nr:hypothetical protein [candidate division WOR-3 bacterium]